MHLAGDGMFLLLDWYGTEGSFRMVKFFCSWSVVVGFSLVRPSRFLRGDGNCPKSLIDRIGTYICDEIDMPITR